MENARSHGLDSLDVIRCTEDLLLSGHIDNIDLSKIAETLRSTTQSVQCHFGTMAHIVDAILERHSTPLQNQWWAEIESASNLSLRDLIAMMVYSNMQKLDDRDGGRAFIALSTQLIGHSKYRLIDRPIINGPGALRVFSEIAARIDLPPQVVTLRTQRVVSTMFHSINEYGKLNFVVPTDVYASDLVDTLVALVSAKVSNDTLDFIDESAF